ncbi:DNA polymerase V [Nitrosospira multiformis]|uniref:DNA polymerase V n=1 Tax=Nitrosospira multiformis TaxID=1231 RepID=A0A1I7IA96_9PROT|nr:DNA polymerase V [Nitrosospira multiformis]
MYSIDESFLDLGGLENLWPSFIALGQSIRQRMRQWIGLPVCVGIGPSKTLAKLANHIAKKNPHFNGVYDLASMPLPEMDALMAAIEVGEVWGGGRRINAHLQAAGIRTVKDLRDTPPACPRSRFGVVMERTGSELRGISCLMLEEVAPPKKQIISSRSFRQLVHGLQDLSEVVANHASSAGEKLRSQMAYAMPSMFSSRPIASGSRTPSTMAALSFPCPMQAQIRACWCAPRPVRFEENLSEGFCLQEDRRDADGHK